MLDLESAIKHCEDKAKELREQPLKEKMDIEDIAACEECAEEHEQLAEWLTELQERREADEWISVKDKLPEKEGRLLVFTDYGDVTMDSYRDGMFVCNLGNVTHWRPLPKAPESEAENGISNQG